MKRIAWMVLVGLSLVGTAEAGVLKVATYPVRHSHKSARAVKNHVAHPVYSVAKKIVW